MSCIAGMTARTGVMSTSASSWPQISRDTSCQSHSLPLKIFIRKSYCYWLLHCHYRGLFGQQIQPPSSPPRCKITYIFLTSRVMIIISPHAPFFCYHCTCCIYIRVFYHLTLTFPLYFLVFPFYFLVSTFFLTLFVVYFFLLFHYHENGSKRSNE